MDVYVIVGIRVRHNYYISEEKVTHWMFEVINNWNRLHDLFPLKISIFIIQSIFWATNSQNLWFLVRWEKISSESVREAEISFPISISVASIKLGKFTRIKMLKTCTIILNRNLKTFFIQATWRRKIPNYIFSIGPQGDGVRKQFEEVKQRHDIATFVCVECVLIK